MGIASDLSDIKEVSDTLTGNKVARFAYTQQAYDDNDADGVQAYNVNNEQNIPVALASIMKVNDTVIDKGWRARASSITRMLMNHFLGRLSYNVNKLTDMFDSLLTAINANLGVADGFATLNASGKVPDAQLNMGVVNGLATLNANGKVPDTQLKMGVAGGIATLDGNGHVTGSQIKLYKHTITVTYNATYHNSIHQTAGNIDYRTEKVDIISGKSTAFSEAEMITQLKGKFFASGIGYTNNYIAPGNQGQSGKNKYFVGITFTDTARPRAEYAISYVVRNAYITPPVSDPSNPTFSDFGVDINVYIPTREGNPPITYPIDITDPVYTDTVVEII